MKKFKCIVCLLITGLSTSCSYIIESTEKNIKYVEEDVSYRGKYLQRKVDQMWKDAPTDKKSRDALIFHAELITENVIESLVHALQDNGKYLKMGYSKFPFPSEKLSDQKLLLSSLRGKEKSVVNPKSKLYWLTPNDTLLDGYIKAYNQRMILKVYKNPITTKKTNNIYQLRNIEVKGVDYTIIAYWKTNKQP